MKNRNLSDRKIQGRLLASYAIVSVLTLVAVIGVTIGLTRVREFSRQLPVSSLNLRQAEDFARTLIAIEGDIDRLVVVGEDELIETIDQKMGQLKADLNGLSYVSPKGESIVAELSVGMNQLENSIAALIEAKAVDDITLQDANLAAFAVYTQIDDIDALHQTLIQEIAEELERISARQVEIVDVYLLLAQLVGMIVIFVSFLTIVYINRGVIRPLYELTRTAERIEQGDLEAQVTLDSSDEMGQLGRTFNQMTTHLRETLNNLELLVLQRTQRLELVARLGEQINPILNVDELIQTVIGSVRQQFSHYDSHFYLLDQTNRTLHIVAHLKDDVHINSADQEPLSFDQPNSLVAYVAREGETILLKKAEPSSNDDLSVMLPSGVQAELVVPIMHDGQIAGVLDVQTDSETGFDQGDAYVLRSLANQIGVALKNARLYEDLAKLNDDKDRFFSIVAHDLKGPFGPVLGNAELLVELGDTLPPEEVKEMAESISRSGWRVMDLLENLLQWARIQMGRMPVQPETVQLTDLAEQTIDLLHETAQTKQIDLSQTISTDMVAYADEYMVATILRNLTNNALKFTPSGGRVTISARQDGDFVEIAVTDTGVGMSEEVQGKLFQIGVHHSTSGTANESGTGLGLIMCQEMVQLNGGRIWVESEIGRGSAFRFLLSLTEPRDDE